LQAFTELFKRCLMAKMYFKQQRSILLQAFMVSIVVWRERWAK